jgi:FtsH-binding integral membrane protein
MDSSAVIGENGRVHSKFLAAVFGYMFIGLLITAAMGFAYAFLMKGLYYDAETGLWTDQGFLVIMVSGIVAWIAAFIDSIVMSIVSYKTGKAPWVGYIIYALCVGVGFSLILLAGVDFGTIGEAFGITAASFGIMFLIGYFSKADLSPLAFVALALLFGIVICSLFFGIWYLIQPDYGQYILFDYGISIAIVVVTMLITAWDANNMAKSVEKGGANQNLALYCAFNMYSDFIVIFVRILYILLIAKNRN